jgi:hypothetical protein
MSSLENIPFWAIALVLAAAAPWCVGAMQSILEERRRERTRKLLRHVGLRVEEQGGRRVTQKPSEPRDDSQGPDDGP